MKVTQWVAACTFALVGAAAAQPGVGHDTPNAPGSMPAAPASSSTAMPLVDGEVRKVDLEQGKLTLRHGPIPNLDMGGMTMVFRVADAKLMDGLKPGDKVRFSADKVNGAYTVTSVTAAP